MYVLSISILTLSYFNSFVPTAIDIRIDRRCTLQEMKERLVTYVQQDPTNFKVYRIYSNNQEYEMSRLNDQLTTVPNDTRLVVRLGRALQPGEVRVRLSLLRMDQTEV